MKYVGYGFLASAAGAALGLAVGLTLLPWIICNAWAILYTVGEIQYGFYPATSAAGLRGRGGDGDPAPPWRPASPPWQRCRRS